MKHKSILLGIAALFFTGPTLLVAQPETESPESSEVTMQQMHSHMQKMQEQMKRIHAISDSEERRNLMQEHMQTMHEGIAMMSDMGDEEKHVMMKMGDMQMQESDSQSHAEDMSCQRMTAMEGRHLNMQQQVHLMQKMMEQMMEDQSVQELPSK